MEKEKILNDPDVDAFLSNPMIVQLHKDGNLGKISSLALSLGNVKRNNALRALSGMMKLLYSSSGGDK